MLTNSQRDVNHYDYDPEVRAGLRQQKNGLSTRAFSVPILLLQSLERLSLMNLSHRLLASTFLGYRMILSVHVPATDDPDSLKRSRRVEHNKIGTNSGH